MKKFLQRSLSLAAVALMTAFNATAQEEVRVVVIGGLDLSGTWQAVEAAAEEALGLQVTTVLTAPKERIVPLFMEGEADLMLIHGGDETFSLQALGYAAPLQTWGFNEFVFVGPDSDPAGIAQAISGADAIQKIQSSQQPLLMFRDPGSYNILQHLLDTAGLIPAQLKLIPDAAARPQQVLQQASRDQASVLVGHIPVAFGRMTAPGMKVLFSGDSAMRRAYVVVTPGPIHPANETARANSERLAEFLVSEAGQNVLMQSVSESGSPWIFPRNSAELQMRPNAPN